MTPSDTVQANFPLRLQAQRLNEELAASQRKLREYENLFKNLYHDACEPCKESFQRIVDANLVSHPTAEAAAVSPSSVDLPYPTQNVWGRLLQSLRISFPWSSTSQHGQTTFNFDHGSHEQVQPSARGFDPNVPVRPQETPSNDIPVQTNWLVSYGGSVRPTVQVKLEHIWTHGSPVGSVKFSPDGRYLAAGLGYVGHGGEKTYIYDVKSGREICVLQDQYARERDVGVCVLSFSPDGRYLAIAQRNGRIPIWQVEKKQVRNAFRVHVDPTIPFTCTDFSPDGRFLVTGSIRAAARIWYLRDGSSIVLGDNQYYTAAAVKFSPDGKSVATSGTDGVVFLWNVRTRKLVRKWKAHDQEVWAMAFTPDGKRLVTGSGDTTTKCWDLNKPASKDLSEALVLTNHSEDVSSVAISPDGRWVASGSYDRTSQLRDMGDASLQCTLLGHERWVQTVDFSPTEKYLACGSWDGKVSMWRYESSGVVRVPDVLQPKKSQMPLFLQTPNVARK